MPIPKDSVIEFEHLMKLTIDSAVIYVYLCTEPDIVNKGGNWMRGAAAIKTRNEEDKHKIQTDDYSFDLIEEIICYAVNEGERASGAITDLDDNDSITFEILDTERYLTSP